ncbi:hypothetical protein FACS1894122_02060 [Alphaproteobacteria bacterium]|nr:hypothetical protein FACS1894122_02060 [Alphaproteobacteria bacterium]
MNRRSKADDVSEPIRFYYTLWLQICCVIIGIGAFLPSLANRNSSELECALIFCGGLLFLFAGLTIFASPALEIGDKKIRFRSSRFFIKMEEIDKNVLVAIVSTIKNSSLLSRIFILYGIRQTAGITILTNDNKYGYKHIDIKWGSMSKKEAYKAIKALNDICVNNRKNVAPSNHNDKHKEFSKSNAEKVINDFRRNEGKNKWHDSYLNFFADKKKIFFKLVMYAFLSLIPGCFAYMLFTIQTQQKIISVEESPLFFF